MSTRTVLCLTGIRSEYFLQRPLFRAIMNHSDLNLELVVAGAHMSPLHDCTVRVIEQDGFPIVERVDSMLYSNRDAARLKGAGIQLQILTHIVDARRPDWLLATADREEPMMLALCGAYLNIATAHYCAGDRVVGNVDDMVRHAVSRLSHLMLTTHEEARRRLIRAGEEEWRVHNVGHTGLDRFVTAPVLDNNEMARRLNIAELSCPYVVVIQHSISSEIELAGLHMRETMEALRYIGLPAFIIYPNSDAGSHDIITVIEEYRSLPGIHIFRNIEDDLFVNLLRGASALVGNSSLGFLEAPFLKLPVINVGNRQKQRHHAENVFFVPSNRNAIANQLRLILSDAQTHEIVERCKNPFGDGHASERIANLLAGIPLDRRLLNKDLSY